MRVPIGYETTASTKREASFSCKRCGHRARATVVGVGQGMQSYLNSRGTAARRARADAEKDVVRTIRCARCPSCKRRNPGALLRFWQPFLIMAVVLVGVGFIAGYYPTWSDMNMSSHDKEICAWLMPLIFAGVVVLVVPFQALIRWGNLDARVKWLP